MISNTTFILVYAVALSVAVVGGAVYWGVTQIRRMRVQQEALAEELAAALRKLELLAAMNSASGANLGRVERECTQLADRLGLLEMRGESRPFHQAIDSARNGADSARLARQFGLSSPEATLMKLVHGSRAG